MAVPYCLDDCSFVVEPEVRQVDSSSSILLSQDSLGIYLPKETEDLYIENYKALITKSKMRLIDGEIYRVHRSEESIL